MSDRKSKQKKFKKRGQESSSSTSSSSESTSSLSSDDESNARDLKPIKEYLGDRKELARQLFIAVKGDKLRMMLPQVLKKMELTELEEWCANELSGMSKARILSILNGQSMIQSSDSNDSDDSGPSLEIISDTEEWGDVSDIETTARAEESVTKKPLGSKKDKTRSKLRGERPTLKEKEKTRSKSLKGKVKSEADSKAQKSSDLVKVKKEIEGSEQAKEKDGESLLDLLELEMRARAIRALIRKEEDIIPVNPSSSASAQSSASNPSPNPSSISSMSSKTRARNRQLSLKVVQDKLQELDSNFNRSVSKNAQEISEEEDVVLVLQPTTTIELLSSESEDEGGQGKRRNQKLENERVPDKSATSIVQEPEISADRDKRKLEEARSRESGNEPANEKNKVSSTDSGCSSTSTKILSSEAEKGGEKSPKKVTKDLEMFRMFKKKSQLKELDNNATTLEQTNQNCAEEGPNEALESTKSSSSLISEGKKIDTPSLSSSPRNSLEEDKKGPEEIAECVKPAETEPAKIDGPKKVESKAEDVDEDKSTDLEIIIDLDDYPDDMEDLDTGDKSTNESNSNSNSEGKRVEVCKEDPGKSTDEIEGQTAETWATRYYQTEDVQSVIKESKIQSEIRKRLRERQRLARLNNSPGLNAAQTAVVATPPTGAEKSTGEKEDSPTTGSVEEYLALKTVDQTGEKITEELGKEKIAEPVSSGTAGSQETETINNDEKVVAEIKAAYSDKVE